MRHPLLLSPCALLLSITLHVAAQQPELNWSALYYTGQGSNTGKCIVAGTDSAVYSFGDDGFNSYLAKYRSSDGQPQWSVQWDSAIVAVDLVQHPNGMLVAAWQYWNTPYNTPLDVAVSAFSHDGDTLWNFVWNDSLDRDDVVRDLHVDANGDIVLCALTEQDIGGFASDDNITLIKLDAAGNLLWRRTWNGPNNNEDQPNAIWTDAASNIYITGYSYNGSLVDDDLILLKYDAAGTFQWLRTINRNSGFGSHVDQGMRVIVDNDGYPVVAGITESPGSNTAEDISAYRYDPAGNLLDQYQFDLLNEQAVIDMAVDLQNRIILLGRSATFNGNGPVLMRLDPDGSIGWSATDLVNGIGAPHPMALALAPNGNIITTGYAGDQLLRDSYVTCYQNDGTLAWSHFYTAVGSFNQEEGHDVAVGANNNIYVTGMNEQSGQSLIRGVTYCLCPVKAGICLLAPEAQTISGTSAFCGADIDHDGWRDLILNTPFQSALTIYHGGASGFTLTFPVSLPGQPSVLLSGDLDQDGDPDVVAAAVGGTDIWLVINNGGTLAYTSTISLPHGLIALRIADVDGTNGNDIVAIMNDGTFLVVLLNNGSGSFTASTPTGPAYPYSLAVGDANEDGDADLVIGSVGVDSAFVMNGDGLGGFGAPHGYAMNILSAATVAIGDMDFDGTNDLVATNGSSIWSMRSGLGGGAFGPPHIGGLNNPGQLVIAPFPQDTSFRLLAGCYGKVQKVSFSPCSGAYATTNVTTTFDGANYVDVADWSNDGSPDLLDYYTGGQVTIWRNCDTTGTNVGIAEAASVLPDGLLAFVGPTSGTITVVRPTRAIGAAEFSLWSVNGERLRRWSSSAPSTSANTHGLAAGVYLVRCTTANAAWTTRVVVAQE